MGDVSVDHGHREVLSYIEDLNPEEYLKDNLYHRMEQCLNHRGNYNEIHLYDVGVYISGSHYPGRCLELCIHVIYPTDSGTGDLISKPKIVVPDSGKFVTFQRFVCGETVTNIQKRLKVVVYYTIRDTWRWWEPVKYTYVHNSYIALFCDIQTLASSHGKLVLEPDPEAMTIPTEIPRYYRFRINKFHFMNTDVTSVKLSSDGLDLDSRDIRLTFRMHDNRLSVDEYRRLDRGYDLTEYSELMSELHACMVSDHPVFMCMMILHPIDSETPGFDSAIGVQINGFGFRYKLAENFVYSDNRTHWE
jgi:hypothetical protein